MKHILTFFTLSKWWRRSVIQPQGTFERCSYYTQNKYSVL